MLRLHGQAKQAEIFRVLLVLFEVKIHPPFSYCPTAAILFVYRYRELVL